MEVCQRRMPIPAAVSLQIMIFSCIWSQIFGQHLITGDPVPFQSDISKVVRTYNGADFFDGGFSDCKGPLRLRRLSDFCRRYHGYAYQAENIITDNIAQSCSCQCPDHSPVFLLPDKRRSASCVGNMPDCVVVPFQPPLGGNGDYAIPTVYIPKKGQLIHPTSPLLWTEAGINSNTSTGVVSCQIRAAHYQALSGWTPIQHEFHFALFPANGLTYLQWLGDRSQAWDLSGKLIVLSLDCASNVNHCVAFRVFGTQVLSKKRQRAMSRDRGENITAFVSRQLYPRQFNYPTAKTTLAIPNNNNNNDNRAPGPSSQSDENGTDPSLGLIIGIVCGVLLVVTLLTAVAVWTVCWKRQKAKLLQKLHFEMMLRAAGEPNQTQRRYQEDVILARSFGRNGHLQQEAYVPTSLEAYQYQVAVANVHPNAFKNYTGDYLDRQRQQQRRNFYTAQDQSRYDRHHMFPGRDTTDGTLTRHVNEAYLQKVQARSQRNSEARNFGANNDSIRQPDSVRLKQKYFGQFDAPRHDGIKQENNEDSDSSSEHEVDENNNELSLKFNRPSSNLREEETSAERSQSESSPVPPSVRKKLYFSPEFFEPELMRSPPPLAEEFLCEVRRMIDLARGRIRAKRYIPALLEIPESIRETEDDVPYEPLPTPPMSMRRRSIDRVLSGRLNQAASNEHSNPSPDNEDGSEAQPGRKKLSFRQRLYTPRRGLKKSKPNGNDKRYSSPVTRSENSSKYFDPNQSGWDPNVTSSMSISEIKSRIAWIQQQNVQQSIGAVQQAGTQYLQKHKQSDYFENNDLQMRNHQQQAQNQDHNVRTDHFSENHLPNKTDSSTLVTMYHPKPSASSSVRLFQLKSDVSHAVSSTPRLSQQDSLTTMSGNYQATIARNFAQHNNEYSESAPSWSQMTDRRQSELEAPTSSFSNTSDQYSSSTSTGTVTSEKHQSGAQTAFGSNLNSVALESGNQQSNQEVSPEFNAGFDENKRNSVGPVSDSKNSPVGDIHTDHNVNMASNSHRTDSRHVEGTHHTPMPSLEDSGLGSSTPSPPPALSEEESASPKNNSDARDVQNYELHINASRLAKDAILAPSSNLPNGQEYPQCFTSSLPNVMLNNVSSYAGVKARLVHVIPEETHMKDIAMESHGSVDLGQTTLHEKAQGLSHWDARYTGSYERSSSSAHKVTTWLERMAPNNDINVPTEQKPIENEDIDQQSNINQHITHNIENVTKC